MKDVDPVWWVGSLLWGVGWGLFYFGALYWTLRRMPRKRRPRAFLGLSYVVRVTLALAAFWLVLRLSFTAFLLTLAGFFLGRFAVTRYVYSSIGKNEDADRS